MDVPMGATEIIWEGMKTSMYCGIAVYFKRISLHNVTGIETYKTGKCVIKFNKGYSSLLCISNVQLFVTPIENNSQILLYIHELRTCIIIWLMMSSSVQFQ